MTSAPPVPSISEGDVLRLSNDLLRWVDGTPPPSTVFHPVVVLGEQSLLDDHSLGIAWVVPCSNAPRYQSDLYSIPLICEPGATVGDGILAMPWLVQAARQQDLATSSPMGRVESECLAEIKAVVADVLNLLGSQDWAQALNGFFVGAPPDILKDALALLRRLGQSLPPGRSPTDLAHVIRIIERRLAGTP